MNIFFSSSWNHRYNGTPRWAALFMILLAASLLIALVASCQKLPGMQLSGAGSVGSTLSRYGSLWQRALSAVYGLAMLGLLFFIVLQRADAKVLLPIVVSYAPGIGSFIMITLNKA